MDLFSWCTSSQINGKLSQKMTLFVFTSINASLPTGDISASQSFALCMWLSPPQGSLVHQSRAYHYICDCHCCSTPDSYLIFSLLLFLCVQQRPFSQHHIGNMIRYWKAEIQVYFSSSNSNQLSNLEEQIAPITAAETAQVIRRFPCVLTSCQNTLQRYTNTSILKIRKLKCKSLFQD